MPRIALFICILSFVCISSTSALVPPGRTSQPRVNTIESSLDLELTRKLIMAHFEKLDSTNEQNNGPFTTTTSRELDLKVVTLPTTRTSKKVVLARILGILCHAKHASTLPKDIAKSLAFGPIVSSYKRVSRRNSARRRAFSGVVSAEFIESFDFEKLIPRKAIEKNIQVCVALLSKILTFGQLEIVFE